MERKLTVRLNSNVSKHTYMNRRLEENVFSLKITKFYFYLRGAMGLRDLGDSKIDVSLRQSFEASGTVFTEQKSITLIHQGYLCDDCKNCSEN